MITIAIDTREQRPWSFDRGRVNVVYRALDAGDYALDGDTGFSIERKSLDDFCGTISSGWSRFRREIDRMAHYPARVIIVEADFAETCFWQGKPPQHNHPRVTPQFVMMRIAELTMIGVSILWAGDRDLAAALCLAILERRESERKNHT